MYGGRGERGGTEVSKQDETKLLRHSALSRSDRGRGFMKTFYRGEGIGDVIIMHGNISMM